MADSEGMAEVFNNFYSSAISSAVMREDGVNKRRRQQG
jgi:hypothetical protein